MTQSAKSTQDLDDRLADLTDRILEAGPAAIALSPEDELRRPEETVLRLNRAFPMTVLDEKTHRRMEAEFKARARTAGRSSPGPVWQSQQSRRRLVLAFAAILLLGIFIAAPFFSPGTGNVEGAAGLQPQSLALLLALGVVIVFVIGWGRRK